MSSATIRLALGLALAALAGCVDPPAASHDLSEVTGRVTVGGKPADRVTINFTPVDPAEGRDDLCVVERGQYKTRLIAGKYRVWFEAAQGGTAIPARYKSAATSDREVDATKDGVADFELK
jgi:hypothetical protein